jgi:hypothetical protein
MLRSLTWCLGLGAASTALTATTGGAAAPFAAMLVAGVGGGAAGNFGHEVCKALDRRVVAKLIEGRSGINENHVVAQALRSAQLQALATVLRRFWAKTQNNLGSALQRLRERESGTARLGGGGVGLSRRSEGEDT